MHSLWRASAVLGGLIVWIASARGAESPAPIAVVLSSLDWRNLTIVPVSEGALLAMEHDPANGQERIRITEADYVKRVAELYFRLRPVPESDRAEDFRMLALLVWRDGRSARIAVPGACHVMTRDGKPVVFDRELYELLVSRMSPELRRALGGACAVQ